jgi:hypothetical protein
MFDRLTCAALEPCKGDMNEGTSRIPMIGSLANDRKWCAPLVGRWASGRCSGRPVSPLQGSYFGTCHSSRFPGRCPGLICFALPVNAFCSRHVFKVAEVDRGIIPPFPQVRRGLASTALFVALRPPARAAGANSCVMSGWQRVAWVPRQSRALPPCAASCAPVARVFSPRIHPSIDGRIRCRA